MTQRLLALTLSLLMIPAFATSTDAEFIGLAKARKLADVEALAREKLARNAKDDVAL
ncbi:MAG: hypothetical protein ING51_00840, partial [Rhodocyclaceae bacterium]|nr:hypothetical protein [Rhodocyclaceae bacterium]